MAYSLNKILGIGLGLLVAAIFVPIALVYVGAAGNTVVEIAGTNYTLSAVADSSVMTVFTVLLPILAIISLALIFMPTKSK